MRLRRRTGPGEARLPRGRYVRSSGAHYRQVVCGPGPGDQDRGRAGPGELVRVRRRATAVRPLVVGPILVRSSLAPQPVLVRSPCAPVARPCSDRLQRPGSGDQILRCALRCTLRRSVVVNLTSHYIFVDVFARKYIVICYDK